MRRLILVGLLLMLSACTGTSVGPETVESKANPLLKSWTGPYGGVPSFDQMSVADIKPALETAMALNMAEIKAIAADPRPATFDNTIVPLEKSGPELDRVFSYYGIWRSNLSTPEFRAIQQEMAPVLSAYFSSITQNEKLFARVKKVYEDSLKTPLEADQQRLVLLTYDGFASNGATLEGDAKERYAAINEKLAELHTKFANNVLADEEQYVTYVNADQIGGLPEGFLKASKVAVDDPWHKGQYAVTNTRSSMDPYLTFSTNRD